MKVYSAYAEIWYQGKCVARHERCYERHQKVLELEHYLDALTKKPGALAVRRRWSSGVHNGAAGQLRPVLGLAERAVGQQAGMQAMIDVLETGPRVMARHECGAHPDPITTLNAPTNNLTT